ncbi:MAG: hypothetical protein J0L75_09325 [Spirochaetes bacterium]|nr:hypothetical protein [Spirochaetota bacterium]
MAGKVRWTPFCLALALLALPLWPTWMEEISPGNTKDEKERIERENRKKQQAASATLANLKFAVSLIDATLKKGSAEVRVTWMDIENAAARYHVYRSTDPIDTAEALSKAKLLGTVKAGTQQFLDVLEGPGRYFYAVLSELEGIEYKVFLTDQSCTLTPLVYSFKAQELYVSNLKFFYNRVLRSVFLRWNDPDTKDVFDILLYRAISPLDQLDKVTNREPLTVIPKGEESYQDASVAPGNSYHYALVIKRKFSPSLETFLVTKVNAEGPVVIPADGAAPVPAKTLDMGAITLEPEKTNTPPPAPVTPAPVVPAPVETPAPVVPPAVKPQPPQPIPEILPPVEEPRPVQPAVVQPPAAPVVVTNVIIVSNLAPAAEEKPKAEVKPAEPTPPVKTAPPHVMNLQVTLLPQEKAVSLVWQAATNVEKPFYFNIYRSLQPVSSAAQLVDQGLLAETLVQRGCVRGEKFEWRDTAAKPGVNLWYALLIDTGQGLREQELRLLDNYIKYPVKLDAPPADKEGKAPVPDGAAARKPGESDPENQRVKETVKALVHDAFAQDQFALVIDRLSSLEHQKGLDEENQKMITLYLGRSALGLGQKPRALSYFFKLKKLDEEAGLFWIQRALDNTRSPKQAPARSLEP